MWRRRTCSRYLFSAPHLERYQQRIEVPVASAFERIVVKVTAADKEAIKTKARMLDISMSELVRRAALGYLPDEHDDELSALADSAKDAADRCVAVIGQAMEETEKSNLRIAAMEAAATQRRLAR